MQAEPVMSVSILGILCLAVMALLFVGTIAGGIIVFATSKDTRVSAGLVKGAAVGLSVLGGVLLLSLFLGMTWTSARRVETRQEAVRQMETLDQLAENIRIRTEHEASERLRDADFQRMVHEPESTTWRVESNENLRPVTTPTPTETSVAIVPPSATPNATGDLRSTTRPDWLKTGTTKEGYITTTVLSSSLFASEEEAEEDAKQRFLGVVRSDVIDLARQRGIALPGALPVHREQLLPLYLRDQYVEMEHRDLGTVTAPMYRVWMKLEQSPQTQSQLAEYFRHDIAHFRMMFIGLIAAGFFVVPVAILGTSRGIRATSGHGKTLWKSAGVLTVLAVWMFGIYLLRSGALMFH